MPPLILTDALVLLGQSNVTGQTNKVSIEVKVDEQDATTFGSGGAHVRVAGLKDVTVKASGFAGVGDAAAWLSVGVPTPLTVAVESSAGAPAWICQALTSTLTVLDGAVGDLAQFDLQASGASQWGLLRGILTLPPQQVTADVDGAGAQLGAAIAVVGASVHVLGGTGSCDVVIQTDVDSTFSAPVTAETITVTGSSVFVAAPFTTTDAWWRAVVENVTGNLTIAVAIGKL